jgi:hypothetical protein
VIQLTRGEARKRSARKKNNKQFKPQTQKNSTTAAKKRSRSPRPKTVITLTAFSLLLISAFALWLNWPSAAKQPEPQTNVNVPKAAIVDGLYGIEPNATLTESMTQYISSAGYRVDLFEGTNVTIDLLRNIGGYKILILRLHSTIHTDGFLYIFSGEQYTESKYVNEQLAGAVRKGYTFNENETPYFALNAVFLGNNNPDGLKGTTIILTGCNGTATTYVIQRFFERGVKAYVSWNGYVDLSHSDEATLRLVRALYSERLSLKEAIAKVMREVGPDPFYKSELECHLP